METWEQWLEPDEPHRSPKDDTLDANIGLRLDALLPLDVETQTVTPQALRAYLSAMMDMVNRSEQPLALLSITADVATDSRSVERRFGTSGAQLIGSAIARNLRQETRVYDVVGREDTPGAHGMPSFLVVCPLMNEEKATLLAERLRQAMTIYTDASEEAWLTVSVGIATLAMDLHDPQALIARAGEALRCARRLPKGGIWRHSDTLRRIAQTQQPFEE